MLLSPKIKSVRDKLLVLGYDVRTDNAKLTVKLPLACSINIVEDGDIIKTEPIFGFVSRTVATYFDQLLLILIIFGVLYFENNSKLLLSLGITIVGAGLWDAYRYILTESFITRFQILIVAELESSNTASAGKGYRQSSVSARHKKGSTLKTDSIVICPECGAKVLPRADGTCPSCQTLILNDSLP